MSFIFQDLTRDTQTNMHLSVFGEPVVLYDAAGVTVNTSGICKVTEEKESSDHGIGVIVRAEILIPQEKPNHNLGVRLFASSGEIDPSRHLQIKSTWTLTLRGQLFAIESLSPPVAGFIKLNAVALSRELTHTPSLATR